MKHPKIILIGPPGSGKGTQGQQISEYFNIAHITTGGALRSHIDMETEYGTPGDFIERGELVPDSVVNRIVEAEIEESEGFVLEGYPRNLNQAKHIETITDIDKIIYLNVEDNELIKRLVGRRVCQKCEKNYHIDFSPPNKIGECDNCRSKLIQRSDDSKDTIVNRLGVFSQHTKPVLKYFKDRPEFIEINGEGKLEEVWSRIEKIIDTG
jgi:adenylate kinase